MLKHFPTLRAKLAALNLLVFGVILTALAAVVLLVHERELRERFDERLADRADAMAAWIDATGGNEPILRSRASDAFGTIAARFPASYTQLRSATGKILVHSDSLRGTELPLSDATLGACDRGEPVFETLLHPGVPSHQSAAPALRMMTLHHAPDGAAGVYLQIAASLTPVHDAIRSLRRLFAAVVPIGLVVVGAASWVMARRALRPIGDIALHARRLTATDLNRRLEAPAGRDEVAEMVLTINEMLDRLAAAFQAQERFIADASHELKTPVTVLLGQAQVLAQQARTPEEYDRFARSVQDEMRRLARLVDSLLTLTRADAGLPLGARAAVPLHDVLTEAVQHCEALARRREVRLVPTLTWSEAGQSEPVVEGEADLLRAMVENLLRNAVRHAPVETAVEVELSTTGAHATIAVRDEGPGISNEHLGHVFDRFFTARADGIDAAGTGLGLAIAQGVAKLHHGSISAANRQPRGSEFVVRLPLRTTADGQPAAH